MGSVYTVLVEFEQGANTSVHLLLNPISCIYTRFEHLGRLKTTVSQNSFLLLMSVVLFLSFVQNDDKPVV